jgi:hypothetical protein
MAIIISIAGLWLATATAAGIAFGRSLSRADASVPMHEQIAPGAARLDWETAGRRHPPSLASRVAHRLVAPGQSRPTPS